jgi:alkylation response protein AidB-like acyl-CoA dehydrogenase
MVTYNAPCDDLRFVLNELHDYEGRVATLPGYEEASVDLLDENELLPLNQPGDQAGCSFENGVVRTPEGFKEAYRAFRDGGWTGLACHPDFGGQGLPKTLQFVVSEIICCSTNMSFGTYPGLSHGAYHLLERCASDAQKAAFLPHLADGSWSGTMCLTEPHCGTDLGLIHTKAELGAEEGAYKISGTKVFISAGEHDLTDNIVHLVLAKLPDAPPGVRGISLFIVPKFLVNADGSLGPRNGVACGGLEDKMGIKASATCVLNFDDAEGYLVGAPHSGLRAMFTMMNMARLTVGLQGLGLAETAYQSAAAYARERLQGRSLAGPAEPDKPADPIIVHPGVRGDLMTMRALSEGARALAYWVALELDRAERHPDPQEREAAEDLVALLTPLIKAGSDHRHRLRCDELGRANLRWSRLYPRQRDGAAGARRPHRPDLRGHQRHPGPRSGGPQARPGLWPAAAPLLPSGARLSRGQPDKSPHGGVPPAHCQGLRPLAARHPVAGREGARRPGRGGCCCGRLPAPLFPHRLRLPLGAHGGG